VISRHDVLSAALELAETDGLEAVSMRAVAERLGVTAMALYRHVDGKDDLLDGLVEQLLDELPLPAEDLPWDERLRALGSSVRQAASRHPGAFGMLLRRPASTPAARRPRDAVYAALREAGVPDELVPRAERVLSTFMLGFAASEAGGRFAGHDPATVEADLAWVTALIERGLRGA
jgi:AcrR family transcriptional regulator